MHGATLAYGHALYRKPDEQNGLGPGAEVPIKRVRLAITNKLSAVNVQVSVNIFWLYPKKLGP